MAGRPSKYDSHVKPKLLLVEAWCRDGLTEAQICKNLNVNHQSWSEYKKQNPELVETLKRGKEVIDCMVENALLKAAMGYEYEEETVNNMGTSTTRKYAQPNTTALIFWLKNRKPKEWRDKQEVEHSGTLDVDIERMNDNEILAGIETAIQAINNLKK